ncbi:CRISPR-associated helicase Cas3' [Shouchella clausii]|uniref:CRISPR-associated helicase Cas3' n=1 Tax=Shouchella clausii TaxID=79880 RepID=UPI00270259D3|nr:CRISPR-associated helicase Cas3' [Shouchella clausii]MDO7269571.1 CRISPR-associated helicase Cas3' [Shouchella clausii]MDO7289525.1 CRISPR-associated helicase Cas3' [Shouchella clausii]
MNLEFSAHIRETDLAVQTVGEHSTETAFLAREFGRKLRIDNMAELSGFLHDMGKWTSEFSGYLRKVVIDKERLSPYIDHSTAGARYLYENYYIHDVGKQPEIERWAQNLVVEVVGMVILSHHSGLQDFIGEDGQSDFIRRVREKELPYYEEVVRNFEQFHENTATVKRLVQESTQEMQRILGRLLELRREFQHYPLLLSLSLIMKTVFSCLIDADRTNTRRFEENDHSPLQADVQSFFRQSYRHLMEQVEKWEESGSKSRIDELRGRMSTQCDDWASRPAGIYTISIPTGGGKTFASLRYALKHAMEKQKDRIIYVVPYTTILEQNAAAVRKIIQNHTSVLEHHGNVIDDKLLDHDFDYYGQPLHKQLQLARDNWDYPIIFTTMVQFLDAFYAKGTRKARRLHNLMNSVVIFDEVQSVPFQHYHLFNEAVNFLHYIGGSSILLCTATQPAVADMRYPLHLSTNHEMVADLDQVVEAFERVEFQLEDQALAGMDQGQLADYVQQLYERHHSLLVILNTKKSVQQLFEAMTRKGARHVYHLSTLMCPAHRTVILDEVKARLESGEPVLCISTQLIEAGVDISFQAVLRAVAGLDSIAQAAGRCNRHGKEDRGYIYLVNVSDEYLDRVPEIKHGKAVTIDYILNDPDYRRRLLHPDSIRRYYQYYYHQLHYQNRMIHPKLQRELIELIDENKMFKEYQKTILPSMYKTLEAHFQAIDSPTTTVLVPYGRGKEIIVQLNEEIRDFSIFNQLIKEAQQYSINVFSQTLLELGQSSLVHALFEKSIYYLDEQAYSDEYGLAIDGGGSAVLYSY